MAKKKLYELTPEHAAQLRPWAENWIKIIKSTDAMTDGDRNICTDAINGLYDVSKLKRPKHIIFVPSPLVGTVAAGFAAAIWHLFKNKKFTSDATRAATSDATWAATWAATRAATWDATRAATSDATSDATWAATRAATSDATRAAWATDLAALIAPGAASFLVECARNANSMADGGNHWGQELSWVSFFKHIGAFTLKEHEAFEKYELAARHGSWRWMHPDFCIVSDRPSILKTDNAARPHCADGPSHQWRDGWSLYFWHGYRIPVTHEWIVMDKSKLNATAIENEGNAELRRIMLEIYGFDRYLAERKAKEISADTDGNGHPRRLLELSVAGQKMRVIEVMNGSLEMDGTRRKFVLGAARNPLTRNEPTTPHEAIAYSYGRNPATYREDVRT